FLFDEPLSNLDAKLRVQMRAEISSLHTRLQATMIYVTHDQIEAMTMGDKIVVMKSGLIQQIGSPLKLYNDPINRFVAGFIGSPPMNIALADVTEEGGKIVVKEEGMNVVIPKDKEEILKPYIGKKVYMGIRPEDLIFTKKPSTINLKASISVIEPLGNETHLYIDTKEHQFIVRAPSENEYNVGDEVNFTPNLDKMQFFDYETERSLFYTD
ncbi:MAG: TOBE domain-containing protein, partial [Spirochaetaceae bacterium]|nr:TOBE domain-containing protein [Spirochaetaceae bacterium]